MYQSWASHSVLRPKWHVNYKTMCNSEVVPSVTLLLNLMYELENTPPCDCQKIMKRKIPRRISGKNSSGKKVKML